MSLDIWLTEAAGQMTVCNINVTHNLVPMAKACGLYAPMWEPHASGWTKAGQLVPALNRGLAALGRDPERFRGLNPANGWGTSDELGLAAQLLIGACRAHPDADVGVSV
jgi:hypothetical protein